MRVLLIEEYALFRHGLKKLLVKEFGPDTCVVEAADGEIIDTDSLGAEPDLVLLDLGIPELDGTKGLRRITRTLPDARVAVLSIHKDPQVIKFAIDAGAHGFILKSSDSRELLTALRLVMAGGRYVPAHARVLLPRAPKPELTQRQREVLVCLRENLSNRVIGDRLDLAGNTVQMHVSAILHALGATNRGEAVRIAQEMGLFDSLS